MPVRIGWNSICCSSGDTIKYYKGATQWATLIVLEFE